ncbi:MAG: ABC transporter permease [Myxococcales bacterium]|nr:ABC transporter permease [Myxococcales bacterium]
MSALVLMMRLAFRNVRAHRIKNLVVGVILVFGTFVVVTGAALIDSLEVAMRRSITTSVTADVQVYDATARDPLALLGDMNFGGSDNGEVADYRTVRDVIAAQPAVRTTLPMGLGNATVFGANELDRTLDSLRLALTAGNAEKQTMLLQRIQRIAGDLRPELDRVDDITSDRARVDESRSALDRVLAEGFAAAYAAAPLSTIDWMDNAVAPLATDGRLAYFRLLGTDLPAFEANFPRMQLTRGTNVPANERGIVLNESMVEQWLKHAIARELDAMQKLRDAGGSIGESGTLYDRVQRMSRQYRRILYQLDSEEIAGLEPKLRAVLADQGADMPGLLKAFLSMNDENFAPRKEFFYAEIAPLVRLYDINVGDTLPLRAFTKSGYLKSLNVKVYGVYRYSGVAKDDSAAGAYCLVDMLTFRDLYGKMTDAQRAELSEIKASVGAQELGGGSIEDQLFGGGSSLEAVVAPTTSLAALDQVSFGRADDRVQQTFTQDQVDAGVVTNIAVFLKDPAEAAAGLLSIQAATDAAGLELKAVGWKEASGMIGQSALMIQLVLSVAVLVLFIVAIVVINIALVLATLERTAEIGTMRALGAQSSFVTWLFVLESQLVGLAAAVTGCGVAVVCLDWLHEVGVPADNDFLSILFGGKAMFPEWQAGHLLLGVGLVLAVSLLATIYPALLAARVPPVVALQGNE